MRFPCISAAHSQEKSSDEHRGTTWEHWQAPRHVCECRDSEETRRATLKMAPGAEEDPVPFSFYFSGWLKGARIFTLLSFVSYRCFCPCELFHDVETKTRVIKLKPRLEGWWFR